MMQQGKIVKKVLVVKQGRKAKALFGRVGAVRILDRKNVEIMIDGSIYKLAADAVEMLSHS